VVKQVNAVEFRIAVAVVLAVTAGAVLVAKHILNIGAHLVTALVRLHVQKLTRRSNLEAGALGRKVAGRSGEK
jgi:hypothetical protein